MYEKPLSTFCCTLSRMMAMFLWSVPQAGQAAATTPGSNRLTLTLSPADTTAWSTPT